MKLISISILFLTVFISWSYLSKTPKIDNQSIGPEYYLNFDKSTYSPKDQVTIYYSCLTDAKIVVIHPNKQESILSKDTTSSGCYSAFYDTALEGEYVVKIIGSNQNTLQTSTFLISTDNPVNLSRWSPSQINPNSNTRLPMKLIIQSPNNFSGQLIEHLPPHINIVWQGQAKLENQKLIWDLNLNPNQTLELAYEYSISPNQVSLNFGPAKVFDSDQKIIFQESRPWQIQLTNE